MPRLLDMKVEPFLIVSTVNVIIAQRLVRTLAESKEGYKLTKDQIADLEKNTDTERLLEIMRKEKIIKAKDGWEDITFYNPKKSKMFRLQRSALHAG